MVYAVVRSGYRARSALETDNAADNRLEKICGIIAECKLGIHDISRTEANGTPALPRFNMPLELGLFLGARRFGNAEQKQKVCIVFDRKPHRFRRFISDIAGQDIHSHEGRVPILIKELAAWLRSQSTNRPVPGGVAIAAEYRSFGKALPAICADRALQIDECTFGDFNEIVTEYVAALDA